MLKEPVYIHGYGFSSKVFKGFEGIKFDLPFHGKSSIDYTDFKTLVKDIALFLPSKHDIVGWSMGGTIAFLLAYMFPQKVNRIFVIGATPYFKGAWRQQNIRAFINMIKRKGKEGIAKFRNMAYGSFNDDIDIAGSLIMLDEYINLNILHVLPFINSPVFILHGAYDIIVPPVEAFKLASMLKNSKLRIIPGGHFPIRDEKDLISAFFKGC